MVDAALAEPPQPESKLDLLKHEKAKPDFSIVTAGTRRLNIFGRSPDDTKDSVEQKIKNVGPRKRSARVDLAQRRQLMKTMLDL